MYLPYIKQIVTLVREFKVYTEIKNLPLTLCNTPHSTELCMHFRY